jgi:hypothetical protein
MQTLHDAVRLFGGNDPYLADLALVELLGRGTAALHELVPFSNATISQSPWVFNRLRRLATKLGEDASDYLTNAILKGDWHTKGLAAYSFPCNPQAPHLSRLVDALDGNIDTARNAIVALGRSGSPTARFSVSRAVLGGGEYANEKLSSYAVECMLYLAEYTDDGSERERALEWIADVLIGGRLDADGRRAPSYDEIILRHVSELSVRVVDAISTTWLQSSAERIRLLGAQALAAIGAQRSRRKLAELAISSSTSRLLQAACCWALGNLGGTESFRVVHDIFTTGVGDPGVGRALARLLPWSTESVADLLKLLRDVPDVDPYLIASQAYLGDFTVAAVAADSPNPYVRASAALALGRMDHDSAVPLLERVRDESSINLEACFAAAGLALQGVPHAVDDLHSLLCGSLTDLLDAPVEFHRELLAALAGTDGGNDRRPQSWATHLGLSLTRQLRQVETLLEIRKARDGEATHERVTKPAVHRVEDEVSGTKNSRPVLADQQGANAVENLTVLHLTDLHRGHSSASYLWDNVKELLFTDIRKLAEKTGPPNLVVFSGDLTQSASRKEFDLLEETLLQLWDFFDKQLKVRPELVCVPGNHDLSWRNYKDPHVKLLMMFHEHADIETEFWSDPKSEYRKVISQAFEEYVEWQARSGIPRPSLTLRGQLPGDVAYVVQHHEHRLGILGLNSAFLQLVDGRQLSKRHLDEPYKGFLSLGAAQMYAEDTKKFILDWFRELKVGANMLLTHHPPEWLHEKTVLRSEIAPPGRFLAHLYGHMHENSQRMVSIGGAQPRYEIQGCSLFGLEQLASGASRSHGYGILNVGIGRKAARLRLFPRTSTVRAGGQRALVRDESLELQEDGGTAPVHIDYQD